MTKLPFDKLKSSMEFQHLCKDLLLAEGVKNIRGGGTGADQGNDFMFDLPVNSPLEMELHPYIVECKWYMTGNNVGKDEINSAISSLDLHQADGLLLITSSQFSGTAITTIESINRSDRNTYKVKYWDGEELSKRLRKHPDIICNYWYRNEDEVQDENSLPKYDFDAWLYRYDISEYEKRELRVETFPKIHGNELFVANLLQYANEYSSRPTLVTIIDGEIGAGKTGFALGLLNKKHDDNRTVARIQWNEYNDLYRSYIFNESNDFLLFTRFCRDVDFLLFDDFGMFLTDKSESLVEAAKALQNIVQERIDLGKHTIVTVPKDHVGKKIIDYLEYLRNTHSAIIVGDQSLRPYMGESNSDVVDVQDIGISSESYILGKDWLIEKYDLIEEEIKRAVVALLRPDEKDQALRKHLQEGYGDTQTRQDEIHGNLQMAKKRINNYRDFVSKMNFKIIVFNSDGSIEVVK